MAPYSARSPSVMVRGVACSITSPTVKSSKNRPGFVLLAVMRVMVPQSASPKRSWSTCDASRAVGVPAHDLAGGSRAEVARLVELVADVDVELCRGLPRRCQHGVAEAALLDTKGLAGRVDVADEPAR